MGQRARMLAHFIRNLLEELPEVLQNMPAALNDLAVHVGIPLLVLGVSSAALYNLGKVIYRIIYPKTASELRQEALGVLKQGDNDQASRQEAKDLLNKSLERDAWYLPSYLTLATIQLYQEENYREASLTLERAAGRFPTSSEIPKLQDEVAAMRQNPHMARVGGFASPHLEDAGLRPNY